MQQVLFYIPNETMGGLPVFGRGWLLLVWVVFSIVLLIWMIRKQASSGEVWGHLLMIIVVGTAIWLLLPRLCKPIPGTDGLKGLPIRGYGVMLLVAVGAGVGLAVWRGRRLGIDPELMIILAAYAGFPGFIGARAFYVIEYWDQIQRATPLGTLLAIINVVEGGLVVYGSVIGGIAGLAAFIYKYKMPPLATLDLVTPSFVLGMAIGRVGCLFNGCCYGGLCDLDWAVTFPPDSPPYRAQVVRGQMHGFSLSASSRARPVLHSVEPESSAAEAGLHKGDLVESIGGIEVSSTGAAHKVLEKLFWEKQPVEIKVKRRDLVVDVNLPPAPIRARSREVHPTQIYSAINGLVLCLFLLAYAPFRRRDGEVWAVFLTLYPITRFLLEIIRTDEPGVFGTGLTISQVVSLILLVCAVAFWAQVWMKPPGTAFPKYRPSPAG